MMASLSILLLMAACAICCTMKAILDSCVKTVIVRSAKKKDVANPFDETT